MDAEFIDEDRVTKRLASSQNDKTIRQIPIFGTVAAGLNSLASFGLDRWIVPFDPPCHIGKPLGPFINYRMLWPLRAQVTSKLAFQWFMGSLILAIATSIYLDSGFENVRQQVLSMNLIGVKTASVAIALALLLIMNGIILKTISGSNPYSIFRGLFRYRMSDGLYSALVHGMRLKTTRNAVGVIDLRLHLTLAINAFANTQPVIEEERTRLPLVDALTKSIQENMYSERVLSEVFGKPAGILVALRNLTLSLIGTFLSVLSIILIATNI